ncbi:hypothetical protein GCM10010358_77800 [Streptomyces minutiscleroticus]|uniref:Transposase DDE domain-containing protein n=1 Tax=Streptomyces minutiscleroticus TaxID=68238 RepID=A0A918U931_9ACTN|nr:hypothetical protein GCM10010358_77800 [Streptomyces minutiscleroticus]
MKKRIGSYPRVRIEGGRAVVSQAGGVLLVETVRRAGLDTAISAALTPWRKARAVHDPGKILLDVALAVALGGDCLADVGMLRAEPAVFGPVASDPTVSRLIDTLAASGEKALRAIRAARAEVRRHVWRLADGKAPDEGGAVTVDLDGVLVIAHSDKEDAAPTWKRTSGHHPLMGFVDHGRGGSGEPVAGLLRPGNAGSNTAADHIDAARLALAQLPKKYRRGRRTLIRTDSGGGTHEFVDWLSARGRWLSYSVGMTITDAIHQAVLKIPASAWTPAVEPDGEVCAGARVVELDGGCLKGWPKGMRLIVRKERPHPGAQLRFTDADGMRLACFATSTKNIPIAALELRTASARGPRTASAPRGSPAWATCPCTRPPRTRSGWRSSRSPSTCWPGCRCSLSPAKPGCGNPAACGCGCSPPPPNWSPPVGVASSASPSLALDRCDHRRPATAHGSAEPWLTSNFPPLRAAPHPTGAWNPAPTGAAAGPRACTPAGISTPNEPKGSVSKLTDPHERSSPEGRPVQTAGPRRVG